MSEARLTMQMLLLFAFFSVQVFMQHQNCRDEGGVLHIHGNVKDTEEGVWTNHVVQMISEIAKSEGISYP